MSEEQQQPRILDHLYHLFVSHGTDRNTLLDYAQFAGAYQAQLGFSEGTMKGMFKACDQDGDGKVSVAEFAALASIVCDASPPEKLGFLFAVFDNDQSGTLDFKELDLICKSIITVGKHTGKADSDIQACIQNLHKADADGNGSITIDEWINYGLSEPTILSLLNH